MDVIGTSTLVTVEGQEPAITIKKISWEVRCGKNGSRVAEILPSKLQEVPVQHLTPEDLQMLAGEEKTPDAFIAMMEDDEANKQACLMAQNDLAINRCIVRQIDPQFKEAFSEIGALVVDPASVIVNMLDQFMSSPQSATMLLHNDPNTMVANVFVTEHEDGMVLRDMRLPEDVQVLEIRRGYNTQVPNGRTKVFLDDEMTLCGNPGSLANVTAIKRGKVVMVLPRGPKM